MSNATILEPEGSLHHHEAKRLNYIRAMLMMLQGGGAFLSPPHKATCSFCRSNAERPAESTVLIVVSHTYGTPESSGYSELMMKTRKMPPRVRCQQNKAKSPSPSSDAYWALPPKRAGRRRQHKEAPAANKADGDDDASTDYHEIRRKSPNEMWKDIWAD